MIGHLAVRVDGDVEHLGAEIGAHDGGTTGVGFVEGECQVARAGADVQDGRVAGWLDDSRRSPTPVAIDVEGQQVVESVVFRGDFPEHSLHSTV